MTIAAVLDRPNRASFPHLPRPPIGLARAAEPDAAALGPSDVGGRDTDHTIRLIEMAAARLAGFTRQLRGQDEVIADLRQRIADIERQKTVAERATLAQSERADEAERQVRQLEAAASLQGREHERLKANVDRLLAMFDADAVSAPDVVLRER